MKYILINFIFILVLFNCYSCEKKHSEINYIFLNTTTVVALSCNDLANSSQIKNLILSDDNNERLAKIFSKLKPAESDWNVDARISGFIYNNSTKLNFCMSSTIIEINGKKYFVNDELRSYMISITK